MRLLAVAVLLCAACQTVGPASIRKGRGNYNAALQQTRNQQLLLNIVRLRYRDTPMFLEVTSITSKVRIGASADVEVKAGKTPADASAGVTYFEEPTVAYQPLQGDKFVRQLMTPLDLETFVLLYHSGWSVERLMRLCVQTLNGVKNAPTASGPTPDEPPDYDKFREVAQLLRHLQVKDVFRFGTNEKQVRLRITDEAREWPETRRLTELLGLKSTTGTFEVRRAGADVVLTPRSLVGALFYVSQGVEVPVEDEERGYVTVTREAGGKRFDWTKVTGDLMRVRSNSSRPRDAYVAVEYRGTWFYIADNDLDSKSTFALLTQLLALQAGEIKSTGPILTLPL